MCSTSKVNQALLQGSMSLKEDSTAHNTTTILPSISAQRVRQNRSAYYLVDVREPEEVQEKPFDDADTQMALGAICHDPKALLSRCPTTTDKTHKTMVFVCGTGHRAQIAAQHVVAAAYSNQNLAVLQHGMVGWDNPAALTPDFLVVLGVAGDDKTEQLSLALAAAAAAVDSHSTVALILMSGGVEWFVKPDETSSRKLTGRKMTHNVETVHQGEPFKPCKTMLKKFLTHGGTILACTTCVKHRGLSFETDMMECVHNMQMPDLVRMLGEAKGGSLQFM